MNRKRSNAQTGWVGLPSCRTESVSPINATVPETPFTIVWQRVSTLPSSSNRLAQRTSILFGSAGTSVDGAERRGYGSLTSPIGTSVQTLPRISSVTV
eukprot:scaffold20662_cov66-Phaeocystis_antarctica.AAC.16